MDSLRVIDSGRVLWLNVTGSGNETSAHVQQNPRMTIMFCSFEEKPLILRLYGNARVIHRKDAEWNEQFALLKPLPGARQIFDLSIDLVQSSCGMALPLDQYRGERELLNEWAKKKGDEGLKRYWSEKNRMSIDNIGTEIVEKNIQ
jgi:hypothetical protein